LACDVKAEHKPLATRAYAGVFNSNYEYNVRQYLQERRLCFSFHFSFQLNAHNELNTYVYYLLPPKWFGVCYTIFKETTALFAQVLYDFRNVVTFGCAIKH
jgi:hypothetical protein